MSFALSIRRLQVQVPSPSFAKLCYSAWGFVPFRVMVGYIHEKSKASECADSADWTEVDVVVRGEPGVMFGALVAVVSSSWCDGKYSIFKASTRIVRTRATSLAVSCGVGRKRAWTPGLRRPPPDKFQWMNPYRGNHREGDHDRELCQGTSPQG